MARDLRCYLSSSGCAKRIQEYHYVWKIRWVEILKTTDMMVKMNREGLEVVLLVLSKRH
jgi:hypothetical protein